MIVRSFFPLDDVDAVDLPRQPDLLPAGCLDERRLRRVFVSPEADARPGGVHRLAVGQVFCEASTCACVRSIRPIRYLLQAGDSLISSRSSFATASAVALIFAVASTSLRSSHLLFRLQHFLDEVFPGSGGTPCQRPRM